MDLKRESIKPKGYSKCLRVPFIEQMEQSECGLCCLAMVLAYYKRHVSLSELRERGGGGRDGTNLLSLRNIANSLGMESEGRRIPWDRLHEIRLPAILHWDKKHYVVLEKLKSGKALILDPAVGRRIINIDELKELYSGVVLLCVPGSNFVRSKLKSVWIQYLKLLFSEPWLVISLIVWSLWIQFLTILTPMITQYLVDMVMIPKEVGLLGGIAVGMGCLLVAQIFFTFLRARFLVTFQIALDWQLMSRFFGHLLRLPYQFFQLRTSGDLILRANSNMIVREVLSTRTVTAMLDGGLVLFFLFYMLKQSPMMTSWIVAIGASQVTILAVTNSWLKRLSQEEILWQTAATSFLTEVLHGISLVKSEGAEQLTYDRWSQLFQNQLKAARKRGYISANVDTIINTHKYATPLLLLWLGAQQVVSGQMTLGAMFAFYTLALSFLNPLTSLVSTINQMVIVGAYLNRIMDINESKPEQNQNEVIRPERLEGKIELRNVSFRYHKFSPEVIRNVSLTVLPGQKIALVGASGSGKSTLASLLLGLYMPTEGTILYDGQDLSTLDKPALRNQIGVVMQNTFLFSRSIRHNIALHDPEMPFERIVKAASIAEIHHEIMRLPMKYETVISEMGSNISGGQRQRIALARALAHQPAILLLDEATSALDTVTEKRIDENLSNLHCTRVVIAHRLSTIINSDLIIVVHDGQIVEKGTHEELVCLNERYARFYQTKVQEEEEIERNLEVM
ncbi:peptidase domain-containing ABC transporter [Effusibacillus consociatus]|uniref:Peptidase domain-containing ABC transporter n=1 Tax=Effusibacillus consociatus TaxID=1117041 RepID=A0ABV9Q0T5_9BACL